ncbi:MAG: TIGR00730 family Rossman fold protein [Bacteroidetes bacterium]|nr:MAG: TIGR00730 family Rossman fold protein [Bacteroidota bacterium]
MDIKNICVFCSSSNWIDQKYFRDTGLLGEMILRKGWRLVYGGTDVGLMGHLAHTILKGRGEVIGVIPENIQKKGIALKRCTELIVTSDMASRKNRMIELSDAFVALPGGFGTAEEVLEVITLKQLQLHTKPVVFINTLSFYSHLENFFENMFEKRFTSDKFRKIYHFAPDIASVEQYLDKYVSIVFSDKWSE